MEFAYLQSQREQQAVAEHLQNLEVRESLRSFNSLADRCFARCVSSFRTNKLSQEEKQCGAMCAEKFFKHQQRVMKAYLEEQQKLAASAAQQQQQQQSQPQ
ncbi:mitochondrial inner membrane translocase subunit Tim9 [Andalucia godoyi]|uniref:Mitochondrial import inner membrane translocase subunit n=1 Tax=Andalucia godoyi TaxID=505711 RepID=A0A8K0AI58_ANDGO|nr:mitochondrial inner membrane translocase subunit Tim9 [Andalucia godoyi]|eukprot:ANDGO_08787.mRNA.1 mitochondrial inner membrane translocase subunit Tim9